MATEKIVIHSLIINDKQRNYPRIMASDESDWAFAGKLTKMNSRWPLGEVVPLAESQLEDIAKRRTWLIASINSCCYHGIWPMFLREYRILLHGSKHQNSKYHSTTMKQWSLCRIKVFFVKYSSLNESHIQLMNELSRVWTMKMFDGGSTK